MISFDYLRTAKWYAIFSLGLSTMFMLSLFSNVNASPTNVGNVIDATTMARLNSNESLISSELALSAIQEADGAGADTTALVQRYNDALELIRDARNGESVLCATDEECRTVVDEMFVAITADAVILKNDVTFFTSEKLVIFEIAMVAIAIIISLISLYIHQAWKNYQIKKFLSMEISEEGDHSQQ